MDKINRINSLNMYETECFAKKHKIDKSELEDFILEVINREYNDFLDEMKIIESIDEAKEDFNDVIDDAEQTIKNFSEEIETFRKTVKDAVCDVEKLFKKFDLSDIESGLSKVSRKLKAVRTDL